MANRMSKKLIRITLIIMVLALVGGALSCNSSLISEKAPDFTLPTLTGASITLFELEGTPMVLNFWATWCNPCRSELPYFEAVAQENEEDIKVIAINVGESVSTVQTFFGDYEPAMIVALDENSEVYVSYCEKDNPRGYIPITFFVDSEGIVRYIKIGAFTSEEELWDILNDVFGTTIP
jgi:cytochrome c biogenesis protein CcmG/thiol:disulfide interchange protein DsbE